MREYYKKNFNLDNYKNFKILMKNKIEFIKK